MKIVKTTNKNITIVNNHNQRTYSFRDESSLIDYFKKAETIEVIESQCFVKFFESELHSVLHEFRSVTDLKEIYPEEFL